MDNTTMKITIAGGHGKIAMLAHPMLKEKGHTIRALIRKPEQAQDIMNAGAEPVLCDIEKEDDISMMVGDADAVVFAAGAGPGSGKDRKWTVDRDGALKLIRAAQTNGVDRYIMISAMGLDTLRGDEIFQVYQKAKKEADEAVKNSGLHHTIIKPGRLTDEPGNAKIKIGKNLEGGSIPREDVARVLVEVLENPDMISEEFDLLSGETDIKEAFMQYLNP